MIATPQNLQVKVLRNWRGRRQGPIAQRITETDYGPYEGLTAGESLQLVQQLNQPVEGDGVGSYKQGELPSQADPPLESRSPLLGYVGLGS